MTDGQPIRVLVVDDSLLTRRVISAALETDPEIAVVGTASNGADCLALVQQLRPDAITLDVEMPGLSGLEVLRQVMETCPTPVLMVSYLTRAGTVATVQAMLSGAFDFVAKPGGPIMGDIAGLRDELVRKVRAAARSRWRAGRRPAPSRSGPPPAPPERVVPAADRTVPEAPGLPAERFDRLVVLGASTGGPSALRTVLSDLAPDRSTAYLLVQHMPVGMTTVLAELLDQSSALAIREAHDDDRLTPGVALLAPGDFHARLGPGGVVQLDQGPKVHWVRPSVDVSLLSAAELYGERTVAAILTGMGVDGAEGAAAIHAAGGYVIAEDESTAMVWGMPKAVVKRGVADSVLPLDEVAGLIGRLTAPSAPPERLRA